MGFNKKSPGALAGGPGIFLDKRSSLLCVNYSRIACISKCLSRRVYKHLTIKDC